jgi:hypothetical protein
MPTPKGKAMRTTTYADANLLHCLATGRSMSGIVHLINQTPAAWFCKKQNVVETATYGSEFMVARQATEQIMDLRYTLRMMGIPLDGPAWLFGDNQSVITSSTIPHSNLNKRHNALSYHRVREAIAAKVLYFIHVDGKRNPSDVMTKFLGWAKFWPLIQPFLFWKGETIKDISEHSPIPQVIAALKEQAPSGLRGVTRCNSVSPSGNPMEVIPNLEMSPIGPVTAELPAVQAIILNASTRAPVELYGTPQKAIKNPAKGILRKTSLITSVLKNSVHSDPLDSPHQSNDDVGWIPVIGRKPTGNSLPCHTSHTSRNPTGFKYQDNIAVDNSTKNGS